MIGSRNRRSDTRKRLYRIVSDSGPLTGCVYSRPPSDATVRTRLHVTTIYPDRFQKIAPSRASAAWWENVDTGETGPRIARPLSS